MASWNLADVVARNVQRITRGRPLGRNVLQIYIFQFLGIGMGMAGGVLTARTLGPADKGIVDIFKLLSSFIVDFGLLGFGSGLVYYLANKNQPLREIHGTGVFFALLAGAITFFGGLLALPLLMETFPSLPRWSVLLALALAPLAYYRILSTNILTASNLAVINYRITAVTAAVSLVTLAALWTGGLLNFVSAIQVFAFVVVLNAIISFYYLYRKERKMSVDLPLMKNVLRYGFAVYIGYLANILHFKIDQLMINYFLDTESVGIYTVSVRWAEMLFLLDSALVAASLHSISSLPRKESYQLTRRVLRGQVMISGGAAVALALLSYPLVVFLYGYAYSGAVIPLIALIPGVLSWTIARVLSQYITYNRGRRWFPAVFSLVGVIINVTLNFMFIDQLGILGASIASTISYTAVMILTVVAFIKMGRGS